MAPFLVDQEAAEKMAIEELFQKLNCSNQGLSAEEAKERLLSYGPNAIQETKRSIAAIVFHYFWGPLPWMIEAAAVISAVLGHWDDFTIIVILLFINGLVKFFQEYQAGNAVEALKKKLALKSIVFRDKKWQEIDAQNLVPGDVIRIRLGNIVSADAKLIDGDYLSIDQSALTGESLPVTKKTGDLVFSGSIAKQGEMTALILATGSNTYFGKTAKLVEKAKPISHFQKAVLQIGRYLILLSLGLSVLLVVMQLLRGDSILLLLQFILVLLVASIPVAMPAILSVTMALGALRLSKMKALVTRLEAIEEMAGIDILCCDKTGTLTQNTLTLGEPIFSPGIDKDTVILFGALASKEENQDPIELAILRGCKSPEILKSYSLSKFICFDPVSKKTTAALKDSQGNTIYAAKGAPQVILAQCNPSHELAANMQEAIVVLSQKGYRTLGVARSRDEKTWEFLGLLPLFDPLREDTAATIARALEHGTEVKMLTGDNIAIAKEIALRLHLEGPIYSAEELLEKGKDVDELIEKSCGFAQVFPEHKYEIIKSLQRKNHIVGMTGDGVNDAPALKQADAGIAVSGSTDAARSAASLVLLIPGLSVIIDAVDEARRIFERMNSYAIYRITETLRIMFFMVATILIFNFYPVTALMIILLALLNDIPIMAIAYDNAVTSKTPARWEMRKVITLSTVLGAIGIIETLLLLFIIRDYFHLPFNQLQSLIFLKLSIAGHLTLFVARSRGPFFTKPFPAPILFWAIVGTQIIAALIVGFGFLIAAVPWGYIGFVWAYCLVWVFIEDAAKLLCNKLLGRTV